MKKIISLGLLLIVLVSVLTGCIYTPLKMGTYEYEVALNGVVSTLELKDDDTFFFTINTKTNSVAQGTYEKEGFKLFLLSEDERIYNFDISNGTLVFIAENSSPIAKYQDETIVTVEDGCKFELAS